MLRSALVLLSGFCCLFAAGGCATPCGVVGAAPCGVGVFRPLAAPCSVDVCSPCEACEDPVCDACVDACCGCACCYPVPMWGPLSPLFAIFCWGYPDNGCGEVYFGDWPGRPRGCEPCDHWGNWVGPWASARIGEEPFLSASGEIPADWPAEFQTLGGGCSGCGHSVQLGHRRTTPARALPTQTRFSPQAQQAVAGSAPPQLRRPEVSGTQSPLARSGRQSGSYALRPQNRPIHPPAVAARQVPASERHVIR